MTANRINRCLGIWCNDHQRGALASKRPTHTSDSEWITIGEHDDHPVVLPDQSDARGAAGSVTRVFSICTCDVDHVASGIPRISDGDVPLGRDVRADGIMPAPVRRCAQVHSLMAALCR